MKNAVSLLWEDREMGLNMAEPCPHEVFEQDIASQADGLCPLCLHDEVIVLRNALNLIARKKKMDAVAAFSMRAIAIKALSSSDRGSQ